MKRVALINDLSGFGKCSLTAAIPVISALGIQACPLPTAILSAQTGFDSYFFDDYTDRMDKITDEWVKMDAGFDGICSGYLGSPNQIEHVLYMLSHFNRTDTIFLADPVMGDNGRRIKAFSEELLQTMKLLTKKADIITPNLTELCLLADADYDSLFEKKESADYIKYIQDIAERIRAAADVSQTVIVTGIVTGIVGNGRIGNLIIGDSEPVYFDSPYTGRSFSGTGDLFAAVVTGMTVLGYDCGRAVKTAVGFLQPAIEEATKDDVPSNHGVHFEKFLPCLMTSTSLLH